MNLFERVKSVCSAGMELKSGILGRRVRAFVRTEGGAAAIFFVMTAPVWIGGMALGAEAGMWYFFQQHLQGTADAVADAVAARAGVGASKEELLALADHVAQQNVFYSATEAIDVKINPLPSATVFYDGTTVDVTVTKSVDRLLTGFFKSGGFVLSAHAVSKVQKDTVGCVLALSKTAGTSLSVDSAANVEMTGCEALANGTFSVAAGSTLTADCARTARYFALGQINASCAGGRKEYAGLTLDPYADQPDPDISALTVCTPSTQITPSNPNLPAATPMPDGTPYKYYHFCSGASLRLSKPSVFLQSSIFYIFNGAGSNLIVDDGVVVSGGNQTFYFVNGASPLILAPAGRLVVSAPLTGSRAGMLFRGARGNTAAGRIIVGQPSSFTGGIYFPSSEFTFQATGGLVNSSGCPQVIANTLNLMGAWQLPGPCVRNGILPIVASRTVKLTQ